MVLLIYVLILALGFTFMVIFVTYAILNLFDVTKYRRYLSYHTVTDVICACTCRSLDKMEYRRRFFFLFILHLFVHENKKFNKVSHIK